MQDVFLVHLDSLFFAADTPLLQNRFEPFLRLLLLVAHGGCALEILILDRSFLLGLDLPNLVSRPLTSGGRVIVPMRARDPASSITSMALSGKNRSVMYRSERRTEASIAFSVNSAL